MADCSYRECIRAQCVLRPMPDWCYDLRGGYPVAAVWLVNTSAGDLFHLSGSAHCPLDACHEEAGRDVAAGVGQPAEAVGASLDGEEVAVFGLLEIGVHAHTGVSVCHLHQDSLQLLL